MLRGKNEMKKESVKKTGKSMLRISVLLAVVFGIPALCYWIWQPGDDLPLPEYPDNAVWIGHGWLGHDSWFSRNQRSKDDFRSEEKIAALFKKLSGSRISIVYPHLCPAQMSGDIPLYDSIQIERFLDLAAQYNIKVIPWIGGVFEESARPGNKIWRKHFVTSVKELLLKHPRLAGVQVNIEPMPDGNADFLKLLDELKEATQGKILSVAAYPPPTKWHQYPDVHWGNDYMYQVAIRCDQMAVMMYDTAIPLEKFYIKLMTDWSKQLINTISSTECKLLLGIPAYNDAGVGYHYPQVENISAALRGISAADCRKNITGIALYCEWEMDENKWTVWQKFVR